MTYQVYYVGVLVLLIFNVEKGHSFSGHNVKCYSCSSKTDEACDKPDTSKLSPVHCDRKTLDATRANAAAISNNYSAIFELDHESIVGNIDLVCLKVVVKDGNREYILRGCQLAEQHNLDICSRLSTTNTNIIRAVHCSKCSVDECNSSPTTFNFNVLLAFVCTVVWKMFYYL